MKLLNITTLLAATLIVVGVVECKKHYKVQQQVSKDHPIVKANAIQSQNCIFEFENGDKFCLQSTSFTDVGWEWIQENQDFNYVNREGYMKLDLIYYLKFYVQSYFTLQLSRLIGTQLQLLWPETAFQYVTGIHYNRYSNFLCFEMYSDITDFIAQVEQSFQFVQCSKVIVDCLSDFGQWWFNDFSTTQKPFSPYAKWFDECRLEDYGNFLVQQYQPFKTGAGWNPTYRFVGSGNFDNGCWPGQLDYWLYQLEKVWSPQMNGATAPNPFYQGGLEGKMHEDHHEFEGTFFTNTLSPFLQKGLILLLEQYPGQGKESFGSWHYSDAGKKQQEPESAETTE